LTRGKRALTSALAVAFWLAAWWVLSAIVGHEVLLVSPIRAVSALIRLMSTTDFYRAVLNSFGKILLGFALAAALGVALASLSFAFAPARVLFAPLMHAAKATPVASIVVLTLIYVSARNLSVFISFLMVLPVIYVNVLNGLQSADRKLLEMAKVFRLSKFRRARAIYAPAAYPYFLSACELSLGISWKAGIAAEVIGQPDQSVGLALYRAKLFLRTPELFAWTLAVILLSIAFEKSALVLLRKARGGG